MSDGVIVGYPASTTFNVAADEVVRNFVTEYQQITKISLGADGQSDLLLDSGQQLSVSSLPVVIASDQSSLTIAGSVTINNPTIPETTVRIVEGATYSYFGFATPGSSTTDSVWKIKRITNSTGDVLFADGDSEFNNIWTNYGSLTYI